jgi:hypothetical protein
MSLKNSQVHLTIRLEGAHKPWFVFSKRKNKLFRVFNPDLNPGRECHQVIHLREEFVNHAISLEGRVSSSIRYAHDNWKKISEVDRLEACLSELASALGAKSFSYKVIKD